MKREEDCSSSAEGEELRVGVQEGRVEQSGRSLVRAVAGPSGEGGVKRRGRASQCL